MSSISVRLPESIHQHAKRLARRDGCSLNQLIASAVGEKLSAMEAEEYPTQRADRGAKVNIKSLLDKVPNVKPAEEDRL